MASVVGVNESNDRYGSIAVGQLRLHKRLQSAFSRRSLDVSKEFIDEKNREIVVNDLKQIPGAKWGERRGGCYG